MNLTGLFFKTSTNFHPAEFLSSGFRCQTRGYGSNFTFAPIQLDLTHFRTRNWMMLHGFSRVLWSGLSIRLRSFQQSLQLHEDVGVHSNPPAKIQDDFAGMFDHSGGPIHDPLQYRLQSSALGGNLSGQDDLMRRCTTNRAGWGNYHSKLKGGKPYQIDPLMIGFVCGF